MLDWNISTTQKQADNNKIKNYFGHLFIVTSLLSLFHYLVIGKIH